MQSINSGQLSTARIQLNLALKANPADPQLHFLNGRVALESGNVDLAKTELAPLLQNPNFAKSVRTMLAQAHLMSGQPKLALETLGSGEPDSGHAYAVAVDAQLALGQTKPALDLLAKGRVAFPQSKELMYVDAQTAIALSELPRADAIAARILEIAPNDVRGLLLAGRIDLFQGDRATAEKLFDRALKQDRDNQLALLAKAAIAHERGDAAATKSFLDKASKQRGSGDLFVAGFMAQLALEAGDAERANTIIAALPSDLDMPYIAMLRGVIASTRKQHEQAISILVPFFSQGVENPAARLALSSSYAARGDTQKAWDYLKPLADAANANVKVLGFATQLTEALHLPESGRYRSRLENAKRPDPLAKSMTEADLAIAEGDWRKADAIYQKIMASNPASGNVILYNNAANARLQLGDTAQAVALARKALALAPDDPIVADTLGWCLFKQSGATTEVVTLMRQAYAAQPNNPAIRSHLIQISKTLKPIQK